MRLLRLIGSGALIASGLLLYFEAQSSEKSKIRSLNAYISLIRYVKNQIENYLMPLDDIFLSCDADILCECGLSKAPTALEIKREARTHLPTECAKIIENFCDALGKSYREGEMELCGRCIHELSECLKNIKEDYEKDRRVRFALCISASLSIILILI